MNFCEASVSICVAPGRSPAAFCVEPRRSLCRVPALCVRARPSLPLSCRLSVGGPALSSALCRARRARSLYRTGRGLPNPCPTQSTHERSHHRPPLAQRPSGPQAPSSDPRAPKCHPSNARATYPGGPLVRSASLLRSICLSCCGPSGLGPRCPHPVLQTPSSDPRAAHPARRAPFLPGENPKPFCLGEYNGSYSG